MPSLQRTSDAATEPVSTAEAKQHLNVDISTDDTYIGKQITVARQYAEEITGRSFITQTWTQMLDAFPRVIELERGDVIAITTLKYIAADGTLTELTEDTHFQVDITANPARVMPERNTTWPTISSLDFNAVQIVYTAGYGAAAAVPEIIKDAVKILVAHLHGFGREVTTEVRLQAVPHSAQALLESYRLPGF